MKIVHAPHIKHLLETTGIFRAIHDQYGSPPNWQRPEGFISLVKIILEQQVSLAAGKAHYTKLEHYLKGVTPVKILQLGDEEMKACQVSRQKAKCLRSLATAIINSHLNVETLSGLTESEIRRLLTSINGIGHWTADIYLMFCLQSPDIFPIGDVAIVTTIRELSDAHTKEEIISLAENWRPFRSLASYFLWHYYLQKRGRPSVAII